jgi:O-succinylbenzoate synthase
MSTLAGFTLPGDVSAGKRYYKEDIIQPPVEVDSQGFIAVPEKPGIGFEPDLERIEAVTLRKLEIRP